MAARERFVRPLLAVALAVAVAFVLLRLAAPAQGPVEPAWDRVACARCGMLVSDPAFAAQLHAASGEVFFFDDPGCLLLERAESAEPHTATWFHTSEGWLPDAEVGFVRAPQTPMGYGFAAVRRARVPDALAPDAALAALRASAGVAP